MIINWFDKTACEYITFETRYSYLEISKPFGLYTDMGTLAVL